MWVLASVKPRCTFKAYMWILDPLLRIQSKLWVHLQNPYEITRFAPKIKLLRTPQTEIMGLPRPGTMKDKKGAYGPPIAPCCSGHHEPVNTHSVAQSCSGHHIFGNINFVNPTWWFRVFSFGKRFRVMLTLFFFFNKKRGRVLTFFMRLIIMLVFELWRHLRMVASS